MLTDKNKLLKLLGLRPTGDFGPYTIYTSQRHKTVAFPRSPPQKPPSIRQIQQRERWRAAAQAWAELPNTIKLNWRTAAIKANLKITGHNLWIWYILRGDQPAILTVERITGINLISEPA
jgi:hypothetical protein